MTVICFENNRGQVIHYCIDTNLTKKLAGTMTTGQSGYLG